MRPTNVLLIVADQLRWDCLGCYNNEIIETPNIDWLAAEGTVFTNAYSPTPSCVPARASLLTGMNQWNTGILGMGRGQGSMGTGFKHTLPGELAKRGYHTKGVGKMHFSPQRALNGFHDTVLDESARVEDPEFVSDYKKWFDRNKNGEFDITDHGIDWNSWMARPYHAPEFLHPTNWTVNQAIEFMQVRDPSKPFFLKMSFSRPHSPYDAPPYYFELYLNKELPDPFSGDWDHIHDISHEASSPNAWRGRRSQEEIHRARAGYYGLISHIDHQIGRLHSLLNRINQLDNTMIIFTSDHGDMLGDHNLWRKTYGYEGSAHIPLIVRLPKKMQSKIQARVGNPVTLYDIMPTILEAVNAEIPATVDGQSMLPLISGESCQWRDYVHGEHSTCYSEEQEMQYLTDGKTKYIWFPRLGTEQLFNLEEDPQEANDLAKEPRHQQRLLKWRKRLIRELKARELGLTDKDSLVCQHGRPPVVSPHYKERLKRVGLAIENYRQARVGLMQKLKSD